MIALPLVGIPIVAREQYGDLAVFGYVQFESIIAAIDSRYSREIDAYLGTDGNGIERLRLSRLEPDVVAEHTLQAILEDRFYVFTHEDSMGAIEQKFA